FFNRLNPEVTQLRDKALTAYRKEFKELTGHHEKLSKNMPDAYREQYLKASRDCREFALAACYGSEQGIEPESELMFALTLAYQ
ncbi:MAG: hypothetical protein ACRD5H_15420, partial [Nitrososphaerales archaeon]